MMPLFWGSTHYYQKYLLELGTVSNQHSRGRGRQIAICTVKTSLIYIMSSRPSQDYLERAQLNKERQPIILHIHTYIITCTYYTNVICMHTSISHTHNHARHTNTYIVHSNMTDISKYCPRSQTHRVHAEPVHTCIQHHASTHTPCTHVVYHA